MTTRALFLGLALVACRKETIAGKDAGPPPAPSIVPAPNSALAQELGTDDAGRGIYRYYDDGPACGNAPKVDRKKALGGSGTFGFFLAEAEPSQQPDSDARSPVRIQISAPARVGRGATFHLSSLLFNTSKNPFLYQVGMDGSSAHWVSPFIDVYLRAREDGRVYRWTYGAGFGRCGNVNLRTAEDFVTLAPGAKKKEPFGVWANDDLDLTIEHAGIYTMWLVYAACQGPTFAGNPGEDLPIPPSTFEGTIASNGLTIEVTGPAQ